MGSSQQGAARVAPCPPRERSPISRSPKGWRSRSARTRLWCRPRLVPASGALACDADGKLIAMDLKANDTVMLPQYGGNEVEIEDEELVLFRADDILGILKD